MKKVIGNCFGLEMYDHQHSVLEFCEKLHMFYTGAAKYREAFEPFYMKIYLQEKLNNWLPSSDVFDMIVRCLVLQTIHEYSFCSWSPSADDAFDCYIKNPEYWKKEIEKLTR